jgi:LPS sulfotransferase NodH
MTSGNVPLIICTTARSGSNLLCDYLNNTNVTGVLAEYFNPDVIRKGHNGRRFEFSSDVSLQRYVDFLRTNYAASDGTWGAKLLFEDIDRLIVIPAMQDLMSNGRLVFLRRRSKLSQAISYYLAKATGQWVATDAAVRPIEKVEFDYAAINNYMEMLAKQEALWTTLFSRFKQRPMEVIYEDLIENTEPVIKSILQFAGVRHHDVTIKTNLVEQKLSRNKDFSASFLQRRWPLDAPANMIEYQQLNFWA